jgi:hypothetical protein
MKSTNEELSTILNQIIDKAADNLRIAKIIIQLGLAPDHITFDAIFNRLLEIFLANITIANICALVGATFFVASASASLPDRMERQPRVSSVHGRRHAISAQGEGRYGRGHA